MNDEDMIENKPSNKGVISCLMIGMFAMLIVTVFALFTSGCAIGGKHPSALESKLYSVQTNVTEVVIVKTNYVTVTNEVGGIVVKEEHTPTTNKVTTYALEPNPAQQAILKETATGLGNIFGVGGLAGAAISGLYSIWASARNRKVNTALIQGIETAREVLTTTPQGEAADAEFVRWLKAHQRETGVISLVSSLVAKTADNDAAKSAAELIAERVAKSTPILPQQ